MDLILDDARLKRVWNQKAIPVILRRIGRREKLRARLPYADGNRAWLRNKRRHRPEWVDELHCRELPKVWLNDFVDRALQRYRSVYIIQPYREHEKCSSACLNATGHDCECSCMGESHGAGNDGSWFEVSETFATRWGRPELACRLLTAKDFTSAGHDS